MQDEFDLDAVLYILDDIDTIEDMEKVYEIYSFIFEDDFLDKWPIQKYKLSAKKHILNIHPELAYVHFNNKKELNRWIASQKELFGGKITISTIGEQIVLLNRRPIASAR